MRSPRFRTKDFSACMGSQTARGPALTSQLRKRRCCLLFNRTRSAPRNLTRFAAQYPACGLPCERFAAGLTARTSRITRGRGGWLALPREGLAPPIFCQLVLAHSELGLGRMSSGPAERSRRNLAQFQSAEPQRVCDNAYRGQRHGGRRYHRREEQAENWVQDT